MKIRPIFIGYKLIPENRQEDERLRKIVGTLIAQNDGPMDCYDPDDEDGDDIKECNNRKVCNYSEVCDDIDECTYIEDCGGIEDCEYI